MEMASRCLAGEDKTTTSNTPATRLAGGQVVSQTSLVIWGVTGLCASVQSQLVVKLWIVPVPSQKAGLLVVE